MKKIVVGLNVAKLVDEQGKTHITRKQSGVWAFNGRTFATPFDAFKEVTK